MQALSDTEMSYQHMLAEYEQMSQSDQMKSENGLESMRRQIIYQEKTIASLSEPFDANHSTLGEIYTQKLTNYANRNNMTFAEAEALFNDGEPVGKDFFYKDYSIIDREI